MNQLTPFQKKAIDFSKHISLTANAGSGKTFVLSHRFVEIAVQNDVSLNSIVAITFTEKAAGELYKKISDEIEARLLSEKDNWKKKRLKNLRRELVSANISTIHSFCIDILKEFSAEAAVDANFLPLDQVSADELISLSIEDVFNSVAVEDDLAQTIKEFIRYFGSIDLAKESIKHLIKNRKNAFEVINKIFSTSDEIILEKLDDIFLSYFDKITPDFLEVISSIKKINDFVLAEKNENQIAIPIRNEIQKFKKNTTFEEQLKIFENLQGLLLTKSGTVKKRGYLPKHSDFNSEINQIENLFEFLKIVGFKSDNQSSTKNLIKLARNTIEVFESCYSIYERRKLQSSYLDFEDILLKTKNIISLDSVNNSLSQKYKYLMIDEYQDTNEIQYDIVMPILDYLRLNNLFIVGDGKQSIYRFRGAEPSVYSKTKSEIILNTSAESDLSLPHSFRMAPNIAFFVNKLFDSLFENPNPLFDEVEYSNLISAREKSSKSNIEFLIVNEESGFSESELLSQKILQLLKSDYTDFDLSNVAILCRKRKSFTELEASFIKYGIPYRISGGRGFYQRQIVYDIHNYISFLLNQNDDVAFVGILRSPFFHISDRDLFLISLEEGDYFYQKFISYSKKTNKFLAILDTIQSHIKLAFTLEEYSLIRQILNDTGYQSVIAAKQNSEQELANLRKLISLAVDFSDTEFKNLYDFKETLQVSITTLEEEGQAVIQQGGSAVNIMTIHQAKGLEFDTVFIYKASEREINSNVKSKEIKVDKAFGFLAKVPRETNYYERYRKPAIVGIYDFINKQKELAEKKRLLYVATTRAENSLYISAESKKGKFVEDSFMDLIYLGLSEFISEEGIKIQGDLQFMKSAEENFETSWQEVNLFIPITNLLELNEYPIKSKSSLVEECMDLTKTVFDLEKNEVISATKISYYSQCPVKYQFTYEFGYSKFLKLLGKTPNIYLNKKEEENDFLPADVKGRIVHKILEDQVEEENIRTEIEKLISAEPIAQQNNSLDKYSTQIENMVKEFYKTDIFHEINSYSNIFNEYEVYAKEEDFYLYGIIDRFVLAEDRIVIIDYKTDNVEINKLDNKAKNYFPQLTFYAYILSRQYPSIDRFELKIIFLNHPNSPVTNNIGIREIQKFGTDLRDIINSIRHKKFDTNLDHCKKCFYADDSNNCPLTKIN